MNYFVYDALTGEFTGDSLLLPADQVEINTPAGMALWPGDIDPTRVRVDIKADPLALVARIPPQPADVDGVEWVYDDVAGEWVGEQTLAGARALRWAQIKRSRAAAESAALTVDGRTFDADPDSQRRISGAVQLATLAPAGWAIDWTLSDNTVATLGAAEIVAVGVALGAQVSAAHATGRALRAQLDAATTVAEINSITWPAP